MASKKEEFELQDRLGRPLHDLRLSVIDQCNFRCTYCMPEDQVRGVNWLKQEQRLSFDEMLRLVRLFARVGVNKIRLTGGEPLLRPQLDELVRGLTEIPGIDDIAMTTNGVLLPRFSAGLKAAGLNRVTVSLDALDPTVFRQMNGGFDAPEKVLAGIDAAQQAGLTNLKVNTVVRRDMNLDQVLPILERFRGTGITVRFIEYMDVGNLNHWNRDQVVPSAELIGLIAEEYDIEPIAKVSPGEVADGYRYRDGAGKIGFVSSISQPFCRPCNRSRLSADGKLFTCLFATHGTDLRDLMREGAADTILLDRICTTWGERTDQYSQLRWGGSTKKPDEEKIEMFYIGG